MSFFRPKKSSKCKWDIGYNTRGFLHLFPIDLRYKLLKTINDETISKLIAT